MIGSCALKARVEENLGVALAPGFFDKAEQYARRKLDLCGHLGIDLEAAIDLKMAYNETRPFKHGKRF